MTIGWNPFQLTCDWTVSSTFGSVGANYNSTMILLRRCIFLLPFFKSILLNAELLLLMACFFLTIGELANCTIFSSLCATWLTPAAKFTFLFTLDMSFPGISTFRNFATNAYAQTSIRCYLIIATFIQFCDDVEHFTSSHPWNLCFRQILIYLKPSNSIQTYKDLCSS